MQLNVSQQMKLQQQMKLAPRMIQSMEILQLPLMALQERIDEELRDNIVLENPTNDDETRSDTEVQTELDKAHEEATEVSSDVKELVVDSDHSNEADFERLLEMSADWPEDNISAGSGQSSNRIEEIGSRHHDLVSNMVERPQSLTDFLLEQFSYFNCEENVCEFGQYLISNLDHNGRLQSPLAAIVEIYGRGISLEEAEQALKLIQKLEPPGVGARNNEECLLLQLQPQTPCRDILEVLIRGHLADIAERRIPFIHRQTGFEIETIQEAIEQLKLLNPFPGSGFERTNNYNVTPDLAVEPDENGKYVVKLLDEYVPHLRINRKYVKMLQANPDKETKEFIKKKIESAKWLIDSIEQRYQTLRKVAQTIVDFQTEFLNNGPEFIVPLKMQQIADVVHVHVTTVSRAVDGKYLQTHRGLFPLKRFFGGGTRTSAGEDIAWEKIRRKLKEVVDSENKKNPYSDDALVKEMDKHGIKLARRTVTKYRKAMDIPSSRKRKEI